MQADHAGVRSRRLYYYLGGFDPEYGRLSPGKLLVAHALEQAIGEGMRGFDVLRGREDYKYEWGRAIGRPGDGV
ncbi:MAG TPA: GNAT family N-acetyltransferase [Phycisphaerae bacterium]|nr:GNAT family N-acetyltransferase [Phycisphaerae bacterium]